MQRVWRIPRFTLYNCFLDEQGSAGAGLCTLRFTRMRRTAEGLKLFRTMKRKEVDEAHDDCFPTYLSNPSRKFRRLDAEFVSVMDEDPNVNAPHFVERGLSPELPWTITSMVHTDVVSVETLPTSNAMEERARMPYDPTKTPFAKYPSLQKFPIVVQSDLIPGLKGNREDSKLELFTAFGLTLISVVIICFWL